MADENGDYLSRFERVEKTLESLASKLDTLTNDLIILQEVTDTLTRDVTTMHGGMKTQKENTDKLLIALRELIDRIPPENLRGGSLSP
jgi:hypothetical protein